MGVKAKQKSFKASVMGGEESVRLFDGIDYSVEGSYRPTCKQVILRVESYGLCPDSVRELIGKRVLITILD